MTLHESTPDKSTRKSPMYLYALGPADLEIPAGLAGLHGEPVVKLAWGTLAAFVSPIANQRLRPERRHLAAHQGVLQGLMAVKTILPVGFGMVVSGRGALDAIITAEAPLLTEELDRVRDRVEMSLRVSWDVPNIFQYFVELEPALRAARDRMIESGSHHSRVAAGELFNSLVATHRHTHSSRVVQAIEPLAAEVLSDDPKSESEVMRLSALVDRSRLADFEEAVHKAAAGFDASFRFDYSGPWAPHNFVRLQLDGSGAHANGQTSGAS